MYFSQCRWSYIGICPSHQSITAPSSFTPCRQVLLIDYGETATVRQSDISVMVKRFEEHRAFALECHLYGIRPAGQLPSLTPDTGHGTREGYTGH